MKPRELNRLSLEEVRSYFGTDVYRQLRIEHGYTTKPYDQPTFALKFARLLAPDFVLLSDAGKWKGKTSDDEHFWLWGHSPEEVLWKIVLHTLSSKPTKISSGPN